jgi:methyl-accepting chemotaxis protein
MAFTWHSAGHAFASLLREVVSVSKKVTATLRGLQENEKLIESLTSLVSPQAAAIEQIAFGALGELVAAVQATEAATAANGVNVSFDASVVAEVRKLMVAFPDVLNQVEAIFGKSK